MEAATLDDFMAINEQLAALSEAGVPVEIGLSDDKDSPAVQLEKINASVARRVSRGAALADAIEDEDRGMPESYRSMIQLGLRSGRLTEALEASNRLAETVAETRRGMGAALFYPLVVCVMAAAGLALFCMFFVPAIGAMYRTMRIPLGAGVRVLEALRDALPYWVGALAAAAAAFGVHRWWNRRRAGAPSMPAAGWFSRLPGAARVVALERAASFAETLAGQLEAGVPVGEAAELAAGACGDDRLGAAARTLAGELQDGQTPSSSSPAARQLPPFLRWALLDSAATTGRPEALRLAATIYRRSAEQRAERLRLLAPVVACVVIGGGVTLLYGLALFAPMADMLEKIALPNK